MSIFKTLDPTLKSKREFETNKTFLSTNNDSASGVFTVQSHSGSLYNYASSSDNVTSIVSASSTKNYFSKPSWNLVNTRYYRYINQNNGVPRMNRYDTPVTQQSINLMKPPSYFSFGIGSLIPEAQQSRSLHESASIFSITRELYGEHIQPNSVKLTDTSNGLTFDIRDDGDGNLYDFNFSASYAAHKSSSFDMGQGISAKGSGSVIGNAFYQDGLIVVNRKGTYNNVGFGSGWTLEHKATHRITEYEYVVTAEAGEFNKSLNISLTKGRSGSIMIPQTSSVDVPTVEEDLDRSWLYKFLPANHLPGNEGTSSYQSQYTAASHSIDAVTGSTWYPMVSQIGLYDIDGDLIAHAKPGQPIQLSKTKATTFVIRFDV
jgi:hypothetical protein|tara:strand:+ start:10848 stop:11972 length:1125 start_codon:yes stop_codon:yes gene_type:complete